MYRIAVLTSSRAQEAFLAEQISRFCAEHCLYPKMDCYHDQESFFEAARNEPLTNAVIALPGVDGLNAVEHLRALCPQTRIIWCSDLDFSLHAFRLRADYFLLEPVTEQHPAPTVDAILADGKPVHALVKRSRGASLVVVGSRGRGGFIGLLLGSTSRRIAGRSLAPVMVVRSESTPTHQA